MTGKQHRYSDMRWSKGTTGVVSPRQVLKEDDQEPGTPNYSAWIHTAGLPAKVCNQAVGGSKGNHSHSDDERVSYESIVSMKLGHRIWNDRDPVERRDEQMNETNGRNRNGAQTPETRLEVAGGSGIHTFPMKETVYSEAVKFDSYFLQEPSITSDGYTGALFVKEIHFSSPLVSSFLPRSKLIK